MSTRVNEIDAAVQVMNYNNNNFCTISVRNTEGIL